MYQEEKVVVKTKRPGNMTKDFKVFLKGKTFKISYKVEALKEILTSEVFGKIQIPVYVHNSILFGPERKGLTMVGNIRSYNDDKETMTITIFNKYVEKVNGIENPIVFPRVIGIYDASANIEEVVAEDVKILGFDIASEEFYSNI